MKKVLALIPARGGSKRIPMKNIRSFLGRPILNYSIDAAHAVGMFDDIIVSTDDPKIRDVAESGGASVPFFRSYETSNDFATLADVAFEVLTKLSEIGKIYDVMCMILPTAPLIQKSALVDCMAKLSGNREIPSVIPVTEFSFPILRSMTMDNQEKLNWKWPEFESTRSQDIEKFYHDVGQFYFVRVPKFLETKKVLLPGSVGYRISPQFVQDIDTEDDWAMAELKYRHLNARSTD
jgi:N-acylneuraminate cytidylyltransferase